MSRLTIDVDGRSVRFSPDDAVALVNRTQALLKLLITDEMTGKPPESNLNLSVKESGVTTRVNRDGLSGIVGVPGQVFPKLNSRDYHLSLTLAAAGYVTREFVQPIPQDGSFPATFKAQQLEIALHRLPVTISGRVVAIAGNSLSPVDGATVTLTGIWKTSPSANVTVPPDPPDLVHLNPPLYLDRSGSTQFFQARNITPVSGGDKFLADDVSIGSNQIQLSDRQGLSTGDVLIIDPLQPDVTEFIEIKSLPATGDPDQPTRLTLNQALARIHRRNCLVQLGSLQPATSTHNLNVDAIKGDSCVFLNTVAGLSTNNHVQITGLANSDEYHSVSTFTTASDSNGYYRLPPLSRVAQIEIHAEKVIGAQTFKLTKSFSPDYRQRENRLDLTLSI